MKKVLILLGLVFLISCSKSDKTKIKIEPVLSHELEIVDSLIFTNTDTFFIGQFRDMVVKNDTFYISDISTSNIKIFDKKMKHLKTIGRYGERPEEFHKAPYLTLHNDTIYCIINNKRTITSLTYNGIHKINRIKISTPISPHKIIISNNKMIVRSSSEQTFMQPKITHVYSSVILDKEYNEYKRIDKFLEEVYSGNMDKLFYGVGGERINITNGFKNSFIIHQEASTIWSEYTEDGELIRRYYYQPKHYINPPDITTKHLNRSAEYLEKIYYSKRTYFKNRTYDKKNNTILINYFDEKSKNERNHKMFCFNEQGECLFDEAIPGYLADVADGYIYIVTEESPERFVMLKCQLVKK